MSIKAIEVKGGLVANKKFKHFRNQVFINISSRRLKVGRSILEELKKSGVIL
jgi:hypothetical protein